MNEQYIDEVPAYERKIKCVSCHKEFIKQAPEQNTCTNCEERWLDGLKSEADEDEWKTQKMIFQFKFRRDHGDLVYQ